MRSFPETLLFIEVVSDSYFLDGRLNTVVYSVSRDEKSIPTFQYYKGRQTSYCQNTRTAELRSRDGILVCKNSRYLLDLLRHERDHVSQIVDDSKLE